MQKLPCVGGGYPLLHDMWTACLKVPTGMELGSNTFSDIRGAIFAFAPGAVLPRYATENYTLLLTFRMTEFDM